MKLIKINQAWNGEDGCVNCNIRKQALFGDLTRQDFDLLHLPILELGLSAGETLYHADDAASYVYTVRSGMIKLVNFLPDGEYRIVRLLRPGDLAGIEALNARPYLNHAVAMQKSEVCQISLTEVELLNEQTPHLCKKLTALWQQVQNDADVWLGQLTVGASGQRVVRLLLYLADTAGKSEFVLPSGEDMGAILAITKETVSRTMAELKRQGLVQTESPLARINYQGLEQWLKCVDQ